MKDTIDVVAALIVENDRFLICQRPSHKARGDLWEFAGGKVEAGETRQAALIRECEEELGITLSVGEQFAQVRHAYPDLTVQLYVYLASIKEGTAQLLEHRALAWISVDEIDHYEFCPADESILELIKQRF